MQRPPYPFFFLRQGCVERGYCFGAILQLGIGCDSQAPGQRLWLSGLPGPANCWVCSSEDGGGPSVTVSVAGRHAVFAPRCVNSTLDLQPGRDKGDNPSPILYSVQALGPWRGTVSMLLRVPASENMFARVAAKLARWSLVCCRRGS